MRSPRAVRTSPTLRRPASAAAGMFAAAAIALAAGCGTGTSTASTQTPGGSAVSPAATTAAAPVLRNWPMFGISASRPSATNARTGISSRSVGHLHRTVIALPGTVDGIPVVRGDTAYATTTYGRTVRIDLATGRIAWTFTPAAYERVKGTPQITTSSPAIDPSGRFVYATSSDGNVHKLAAADGREAAGWPVSVTRDATHEKLTAPLGISGSRVLVSTGGYIGDAPPYQGKVVTIDRASGHIDGVFNSLCSDRHRIFQPSTCPGSDSAIWGRSGVVAVPGSHRLLVSTSNGPFDGLHNWGDSVLLLSPDATTLLRHWTPVDQQRDEDLDIDVGSTSPALLGHGLVLQGGKDAKLHLLDLNRLHGVTGAAGRRLGGDLQILPTPGDQMMFTAAAVWHDGARTTVFVATAGGTTAYRLSGRRLHVLWRNDHAGTSPALAGGLLYVYDPDGGGLAVYAPNTGRRVATLPAGAGHWNSPVIAGGRILLAEGNSNFHRTTGVLDVWSH